MLKITPAQFEHFGAYAAKQFPKSVARAMRRDFTDELTHINDHDLLIQVAVIIERMRLFGFEQKTHLHHLTAWELFLGPEFENQASYETVKTILQTTAVSPEEQTPNQEAERFWAIYRTMMDVSEDISAKEPSLLSPSSLSPN